MNLSVIFDAMARRASEKAMRHAERDENYRFLHESPLFRELDPQAFLYLHQHLLERTYKRHEVVFKEGTPGICLFIVKTGKVEIYSQPEGEAEVAVQPTVYTVLGEGNLFGELSLGAVPYRTTSARTLDHGTVLLTLSTYDLQNLCHQFPRDGIKVVNALNATVAKHLLAVDKRLREALSELSTLKQKLNGHE